MKYTPQTKTSSTKKEGRKSSKIKIIAIYSRPTLTGTIQNFNAFQIQTVFKK